MKRAFIPTAIAFLAVLTLAASARATFHFMQIEQIIGGVNGDTSAQAVQLRMRSSGQNLLGGQAVLRVWDAAGANPIVITSFPPPNPASSACGRVLIASPNFANYTTPAVDASTRDYVMSSLIPPFYLVAGSMTFEDTIGTVLWRVSWGGAGYTGSNAGDPTNVTGLGTTFGPPFSGAMPSATLQALNFNPACPPATSNGNANDYSVTAGAAIFRNNDAATFTVIGLPIPTVSQWGVITMALVVLACGTVLMRNRRAAV